MGSDDESLTIQVTKRIAEKFVHRPSRWIRIMDTHFHKLRIHRRVWYYRVALGP